MKRCLELPEASKETQRLDNEGFQYKALKKMGTWFESNKATARELEVNLILSDISLGRRNSLDDLAPELAAAVRSEMDLLRASIKERVNSLTSGAVAVVPPPVALEEAAAAELVSSSQLEPLMVANAPPLPLKPELLQEPQQEHLMATPQEPQMVPPFAMAPPITADVPVLVPRTLLPVVGDPLAPASGVGVADDEGFPRDGSYLLEVADAILDDGSGRAVHATKEDVDRLLLEHGLECFIKPKPM